jgi:hypothetical protein
MKQLNRHLLSAALILALSSTTTFAQRKNGANVARSSAQTNVNRNTNINANRNVNVNANRNVNVNVNVDRDVHVHGGYYGGGCCYHPAATAAAVTATAMVTAAVIGSVVHTLPPSCTVVMVNGLTYQNCGGTWYQPQFVGTTTTYVVVTAPR